MLAREAALDAVRRSWDALRRTGEPRSAWAAYLAGVEPVLGATPRVHRFATVPVVGDPGLAPRPLAVWVEGGSSGAEAALTQQSLQVSTQAPVAVLGGSLSEALANTRAEDVLLVRAGDALAPVALERLGQAVALAPDAAVITCDEDELDLAGRRTAPQFRPGPSPDHWLACDDTSCALVVSREPAAFALGTLGEGPGWRHELALVLAASGGEHAAHVPFIFSHRGARPTTPWLDAAAVERHLRRSAPGARVEQAASVRRVRWPSVAEPSLEVIICFRDRPELLRRCADSLLALTRYARLKLALVDNGSNEPETRELLGRLERDPRVRVLRDSRPFNFASLNNAAAAGSVADVLVFLNNDTEIIDPDWVEALLEEALRPEVGAVAPLLVYPDGTVQHAGAAIGLHEFAGHPFAGLAPEMPTPFGYATQGTRNWLAVTAACMMIERAKFDAVGGFDEAFIVAGNDVDLCLRLTQAGYRSLCVPHAVVVHDESRSRGTHVDPADFIRSAQSYGEFRTVGDPFYNPNLTLSRTDCSVRRPGKDST